MFSGDTRITIGGRRAVERSTSPALQPQPATATRPLEAFGSSPAYSVTSGLNILSCPRTNTTADIIHAGTDPACEQQATASGHGSRA